MGADGSEQTLVSTGKGRTTCAYFFPDATRILFSSTQRIYQEIHAYRCISRHDLRDSLGRFLDALEEYLINSSPLALERYARYLVRQRSAQSIPQDAVIRAKMLLYPALFEKVIEESREEDDQPLQGDAKRLSSELESSFFFSISLLTKAYFVYNSEQVDLGKKYLEVFQKKVNINLSRYIVFRG
jgi:hypothetical protein